ncbi:hypothetical protein MWU61_17890 [Loktanella sp. F6476L]|uniref:hypothetical protein n=1 Tax=Loktanella sp. F6476L TaxID=2926405 RepID=UPI001FF250F0|nr:hypothetical protein [Loktanella sp. F6476L]MCK0122432.1 hypothetical protein [Loktanella sp. F6476L]
MMNPESARIIADSVARKVEPFVRSEALDPATRPLPPYNCPTGTCRTDKICTKVSIGDTIDPYGREHIERNACNRCPSSNPIPVNRIIPKHGRTPQRTEISHYVDGQGNTWAPDSGLTAPVFHGDAGLGNRNAENQTYRLLQGHGGRGWQCRYYGGAVDDTSLDLGTYDYAPAPGTARAVGNRVTFGLVGDDHNDMDVKPHNSNPNYAPNLTEKF